MSKYGDSAYSMVNAVGNVPRSSLKWEMNTVV